MNRFYKPTPREYVSTQVDMPWEFLQGVAEQKQKGFDKAITDLDAASKLLDFDVNPGDMPGKKYVQNEYNQKIYGITDYLYQTGDVSSASRKFASIIKDISQDPRIKVMTSAVEPHKDVMKSANKLLEEGSAPWSIKADPNYSTFNPTTGELKPYNQRAGYNSVIANKNYRDQLEETVNNLIAEQFGQTTLSSDGQFLVTTDGSRISRERVEQLVLNALPSIDMANYQYINDLDLLDEKTGKQKGLSRLGIVNSVINERVFSSAKSHSTRDDLWMYNYKNQQENIPGEWVSLEALDIFNPNVNQFTEQPQFEAGAPNTQNIVGGLSPGFKMTMTGYTYTPFDKLTPENKKIALKYFDSKIFDNPDYKAFKNNYVNGNLSQDELKIINSQISNFQNQFFKTAKQNVQARQIGDLKNITRNYVGIPNDKGQFDASNLKEGAGFLTVNTPIYNVKTMDKITLKDLELVDGDKAEIVKEFSYKSPFYFLSGEKPEWSVPRQLVIKDKSGNIKGVYAIPRVASNKDEDKIYAAFAKNSTAIYTPTIPVQSSRSNYKIKFTPVDGSLIPLSQQQINDAQRAGIQLQGSYDIFDQNGNLVNNVILQTPEQATQFLNNLK